jgi:hypothetical protein
MYHIYRIPDYKHKNGLIGKIGVSEIPSERVEKQGYSNFEILESHTDIIKVSERERELQKQYGYPVDSVPYYISRAQWGSKAGKVGGKKCKDEKIGFLSDSWDKTKNGKWAVESGHLQRISSLGGKKAIIKLKELNKKNQYWKKANSVSVQKSKKTVLQYTKDGQFVKEWESVAVASRTLNIPTNGMYCTANNKPKYKSAGGYVWKYKD